MQSVWKAQIIILGRGAKDYINKSALESLVKAALPHIDKFGDDDYPKLLGDLEEQLLDKIRKMFAGAEGDKANVARAAEIVKLAKDVLDSAKQKELQKATGIGST